MIKDQEESRIQITAARQEGFTVREIASRVFSVFLVIVILVTGIYASVIGNSTQLAIGSNTKLVAGNNTKFKLQSTSCTRKCKLNCPFGYCKKADHSLCAPCDPSI